MYARLGLVLAFNLALSLGVLDVIWLQEPRIVLWRLVVLWLGPMLGLAGVALYTAVRWGAIAGTAVPMVLWTATLYGVVTWSAARSLDTSNFAQLADSLMPVISQSNGLLAGALAALVAGLLLLRQGGRLAMGAGTAWS
ncbi:MAG: hypothetical protein M1602_00090 [Firmicutes bacterium]|nr:hypothetical protein [Bacillota bacterium]